MPLGRSRSRTRRSRHPATPQQGVLPPDMQPPLTSTTVKCRAHQPRTREQCCTALHCSRSAPSVPGALVSASWPTTIPEYGSSPHGHMVFVPLWMQHARLDIVSSEIIIPVCPDYSQCVTGVTQLTSDNPTPQDLLHFMSNDQLVARVGVAPAQRY